MATEEARTFLPDLPSLGSSFFLPNPSQPNSPMPAGSVQERLSKAGCQPGRQECGV